MTSAPHSPLAAPTRVDARPLLNAEPYGTHPAQRTAVDDAPRILDWPHLELRLEYPFALLQIRRPDDKWNTMSSATIQMLAEALEWVERDRQIKTLILTGQDPVFTTGADVRGELAHQDQWGVRDLVRRGKAVFARLEELDCPTIAAVNGLALGGGLELILCCDFRFAVPKAKLGLTEANLAIVPGWGGSQRLVRTISKTEALKMVIAGEQVRAERALEIGLISGIVEPDQLLAHCRTYAADFVNKSRLALGLAKREIYLGMETSLHYGNAAESEMIALSWTSEDRKRAIAGFMEGRRVSDWLGR
ncbi:MAG: enoyl-CoA hydratase/isomerase family protein [bacterium]